MEARNRVREAALPRTFHRPIPFGALPTLDEVNLKSAKINMIGRKREVVYDFNIKLFPHYF